MKLTFEIQGYTITIDETEEGIVVAATQGDETIEEFTLEMGEEGDTTDMDDTDMDMDAQAQAQAPQAQGQSLPEEGMGEDDEFGGKLESFMSFIKKRN